VKEKKRPSKREKMQKLQRRLGAKPIWEDFHSNTELNLIRTLKGLPGEKKKEASRKIGHSSLNFRKGGKGRGHNY